MLIEANGTLSSRPNADYRIEFFREPQVPARSLGVRRGADLPGRHPVIYLWRGQRLLQRRLHLGHAARPSRPRPPCSTPATRPSSRPRRGREPRAVRPQDRRRPAALHPAAHGLHGHPRRLGLHLCLAPGSQLPAGLSLSTGGLITGTPTVVGDFSFTVVATETPPATTPAQVARPLPPRRRPSDDPMHPGDPARGVRVRSYTVKSPSARRLVLRFPTEVGPPPQGSTLASDGTISGAQRLAHWTTAFTIEVTDKIGCTGQQSYTVSVFNRSHHDDFGRSVPAWIPRRGSGPVGGPFGDSMRVRFYTSVRRTST